MFVYFQPFTQSKIRKMNLIKFPLKFYSVFLFVDRWFGQQCMAYPDFMYSDHRTN